MSTPTLKTHISVLESSTRLYPTRPAFRVPVVDKQSKRILEWDTITYTQFLRDVELCGRYWTSKLSADGIAPGSVIGLWYVSRNVILDDPRILTPHLNKAWRRSIHRRASRLRHEQGWLRPSALYPASSQPNRHL